MAETYWGKLKGRMDYVNEVFDSTFDNAYGKLPKKAQNIVEGAALAVFAFSIIK